MTQRLKIVTIGGGSSYTPELVEGLIRRSEELPVGEFWLVDVPEGREKLQIVGSLAQRMVEGAGLDMRVRLTLDRREALPGAHFVTTQFRVGGLEARARDERIPLQFGVIGQETTGPGGFAKAMRTIPVLLEISREMEELCPDAWLINFTNPTGVLMETSLRHTRVKAIGLCNVPINMQMGVARFLGVEPSAVRVDFAGLNHLVYGLKVYVNGREQTAEVIEALAAGSSMTMRNIVDLGWEPDFIRSLKLIPCPYHRYYYQSDAMLAEELEAARTHGTRAEVVKQVEAELFELYKDPKLAVKPPQLERRGGAYYSDAACNLIASLYGDKRDIQPVNIRNEGAIADLPFDAAVEVSAVITREGPRPVAMGHLPAQARGLVQLIKAYEELTVQAGVYGDYGAALQALALHPLVPSSRVAQAIFDEIIRQNSAFLPQFRQVATARGLI